ncbi:MAG: ScyD/ScyE family protein [Thermomicrobiales bacterium]|nr:ScyD/ScyE family protein [Thermomicrobiales bacterium]
MRFLVHTVLLLGLLLAGGTLAMAQESTPASPSSGASLTVVLDGVTAPRGFAWGPDGTLHLALAGSGGDARFPIAEGYTVATGLTSSVVTVADGCATPLVQGLVSSLWEEMGWTWGAMDVAFLDGDLYLLLSGAGPTWGSPSASSGVFRRNDDGTLALVADISTWLVSHPPAFVPPDYATDGSLFDLEATSDALLVSEAVGGQIIRITPDGEMRTLADLSEQHPVPTGIAVDADDNVYVTFETTPPYADGSNKVVKIAPDGTVTDAWTGLTRVADLAFGPDGKLYAAELSTNNTESFPFVLPHTGRIVRQSGPDTMDIIVDGLDFPVGLGFDGDGALYVSGPANGATPEDGANAGAGWLARVAMNGGDDAATAATPTCADPAA